VAGSRARTSATPASEPESRASDRACGASTPASFAFYDRGSCSWKTSQLCLLAGSTAYSETWPKRGMTRSGIAFERPTSERPTVESGCSFWPTPDASVSVGYNQSPSPGAAVRPSLGLMAKTWPTPTSAAQRRSRSSLLAKHWAAPGLEQIAELAIGILPREYTNESEIQGAARAIGARTWPTPTAGDAKTTSAAFYSTESGRHSGTTLCDAAGVSHPARTPSTDGMVLNPRFVEALMGFPDGWTVCDASATPSYRRSRRSPGAR